MKYLWFAIAISVLAVGSARAQNVVIVSSCGAQSLTASPPIGQVFYMDTTGKLCTSATGSGSGSNAAASATGSAVPADAGYTGFNSGGNLVGVSTANPMPVIAALPVGAATSANQEVTAAGSSASSAQAVQGVTNGVALPAALASGADVVEGTQADSAYAGSGSASVVSILKGIYTGVQGVITAITNSAITYPTPPAAPTVSASGAVTSLVLKSSATVGGVKYFHAENGTITAGYCILYNGTTAPSTGALTAANVLAFQLLPASGYCDVERDNVPFTASTGAVVLLSSASTPFTYTTGAITGSIYGLAQ